MPLPHPLAAGRAVIDRPRPHIYTCSTVLHTPINEKPEKKDFYGIYCSTSNDISISLSFSTHTDFCRSLQRIM